MATTARTLRIAFDIELMRPGCVIMQALHGCEGVMADAFATRHWLMSTTPNMRAYRITEEQLEQLVRMVEERHP